MRTRPLPILALLLSAGAAIAQPPPPHDQRAPDPLRGPDVRDRQVPGVNGSFGEPGGDKKRMVNENRLPPRVFRDALGPILSPDAPENLRVTDEQRTRYQGWMDDFQKSIGAYMKEHREELGELRRKAGEPGGPRRPNQGGPGGPQGKPQNPDEVMRPDGDPKETGAARERLQAVMAGAPKIEDLYTKIWTELKPDQQKAVDAKLDEFRAKQTTEREENYVRQKLGKKKGGADGAKPAPANADKPQGAPSDRAPGVDPQRRERLIRLFSQLTPEQQEQMLQRLERAREENGGKLPMPNQLRRGKGGPQGPGEPKPAPNPDDSMMPPNPPQPAEPPRQP